MPSQEKLNEVLSALKELDDDSSLPKNVKNKIISTIKLLEEKGEISIKVSRALHEIEQLADDVNTPSFLRTQLFHITSMLEVV